MEHEKDLLGPAADAARCGIHQRCAGFFRRAWRADSSLDASESHDTAPTRFQDIGGVRLAYRRFGKEGVTPVICLQHFLGTMNNSDPIHTNRLAQERPVILVDYRGVGRSEGQTPDTVSALAADIIAFLRTQDLKSVDLFGFSLGGFVAQQIALDAPALTRRLILAGTGPAGGEGMQEYSPQVKEIISRPNTSRP